MNKTFKLGSVVAALVLGGMLVGCGSSSSSGGDENPPSGDGTDNTTTMSCKYNTNDNVTLTKGYDIASQHAAFIDSKVKKDPSKPLAWDKDENPLEWDSTDLTLSGHTEINTTKIGNYPMTIVAKGCDVDATINVKVVEESTDTQTPSGDTVLPF